MRQGGVHGEKGGMGGEGCVWQGEYAWQRGGHAGKTATETGDTHPTGMHYSLYVFLVRPLIFTAVFPSNFKWSLKAGPTV